MMAGRGRHRLGRGRRTRLDLAPSARHGWGHHPGAAGRTGHGSPTTGLTRTGCGEFEWAYPSVGANEGWYRGAVSSEMASSLHDRVKEPDEHPASTWHP